MRFTRIPFFLGFAVLIVAILLSVVNVSQQRSLSDSRLQAAENGAFLTLQFSPPDTVSLLLDSSLDSIAVDATVTYPIDKLIILSSSLQGMNGFSTAGEVLDIDRGIFSFSALANTQAVTSAVIATFQIKPLENVSDSEIELLLDKNSSAVIESDSQQNILINTSGTKFQLEQL